MFDRSRQRSETYRPRPHACSVTGSVLLAAAVPALCWAVSYPLAAALFAVALAALAAVGRALRGRVTGRSASGPPVDPADPAEHP
jgi:hypothetical protein